MKKKIVKKLYTLEAVPAMIESLAASTARGFEEIHKDISELKENVKSTRQAILDVGDRFVPRYEFDTLLVRFNRLEEKVRGKLK